MKGLFMVLILLFFVYAPAQTVREMRFENVKLETVLKALAESASMSVIFDPAIAPDLQKTITVSIVKPVPVGEVFNLVLKEYGLIAVPAEGRVFKITKASQLSFSLAGLENKQVDELLQYLKMNVSPSAEIIVDKTLKVVTVRDEESVIKRLEPIFKDYRKLAETIAPSDREQRQTRVYYLRYITPDEAERRIKLLTKPETVISKVYSFSALVITDTVDNLNAYAKALEPFLTSTPVERKPVTKIFYLKYISPDEFIKMTEPLRSEASMILSGGALLDPVVTPAAPQNQQQGQQPQQQQQQQQVRAPTPIIKEFNAVMITDYPDVIETIRDRFKDYISESPVRVSIEARIMEIREEGLRELGINWNALLSQATLPQFVSGGVASNASIGAPLSPTPGLSPAVGGVVTLTYQRGILNALNLRLSALERVNKARSLAKPTVVTINGQKAVIRQGTQVPYQTAAVGGGGTAVPNVQFVDVVLQLDVTPVVSPDGRILIDVKITRDTIGAQTATGPAINKKEINTKIIVENGQTVVLGGVIDNQDNTTVEGVPGLVRVPLLKYLLGQERFQNINTELLIFITPTIITQ
ncbi:MAG: pilus assembly protein [Aquificaceae bacterium]